ncbi:hypothetical protein F444_22963, partial [Phytophthora nicotianae P1976]
SSYRSPTPSLYIAEAVLAGPGGRRQQSQRLRRWCLQHERRRFNPNQHVREQNE